MRQEKYYEAYLDDYDKVIVFMSRNSYEGVSNKFYLKDDQGHLFDLHIQSIETTQNNYNKYRPDCICVMGTDSQQSQAGGLQEQPSVYV